LNTLLLLVAEAAVHTLVAVAEAVAYELVRLEKVLEEAVLLKQLHPFLQELTQ
jgi:hypothetical protein